MGIGAGLYMYVIVVQKFTFAISSPDEFLFLSIVWGGVVVQWVECWTLRSVGRGFKSSRQRCVTTICLYLCASVIKQYNLVLAKGRWCSAAGEVTAGLAESNGSYTAKWMTYGHLRADCLYTGISSGPNARYRVWESLCLYLYLLVFDMTFSGLVQKFDCKIH